MELRRYEKDYSGLTSKLCFDRSLCQFIEKANAIAAL